MPNLGEQSREETRDTPVSFGVYECLIFAFGVLRVGRVVYDPAWDTVRKF